MGGPAAAPRCGRLRVHLALQRHGGGSRRSSPKCTQEACGDDPERVPHRHLQRRHLVLGLWSGPHLSFVDRHVHTFCCDVVGSLPLQKVAHVWNLTQAVLRKASTDVESSLVVLCIVLAFSVPFLAVDMTVLDLHNEDLPRLLPGLCVTCGILYSLLLAAMVSEKSARVPALINAVSFGPGTELARQQMVDYVTSSAAGFYVFDMRLTTERVVKFMYVWCLVVMGVLTQLVSSR